MQPWRRGRAQGEPSVVALPDDALSHHALPDDLGANGITSFALPEGSYFFVIVGDDDAVEGSYGPDGALTERPASGACGLAQDLGNTCAQP